MSAPKSKLRQAAEHGVAWSAVEAFGAQLIRVVTLIVLARTLGPEAFGLVAMAMAVIALSDLLIGMGLNSVLIQRADIANEQINAAFWTATTLSAALAIIVFAMAPLVGMVYSEPRVVDIVRWLSVVVAIRGTSTILVALIQKSLNFATLAKRRLLAEFGAAAIAMAAVWYGAGVNSLVAQHISLAILETVLVWWLCPWKPSRATFKGVSELLRAGSVISATKIVDYVNAQSPYIIVGTVLGAESLGLFSVARRIMEMIRSTVYTLIHRVSFPVLAAAQDDHEQFQQIFYSASAAVAVLVFPAFTAVYLLSEQLVTVGLGERWLASAPLVKVLALVGAASCVMMLHPLALMAKGKFHWRLRVSVLRAVLGIPLFLLAAPLGILAAAWALLARNVAIDPLTLYLSRRAYGVSLHRLAQALLPASLASVSLAGAIVYMLRIMDSLVEPVGGVITLIASLGVGAVAYTLTLLVFWGLTRVPPVPRIGM